MQILHLCDNSVIIANKKKAELIKLRGQLHVEGKREERERIGNIRIWGRKSDCFEVCIQDEDRHV